MANALDLVRLLPEVAAGLDKLPADLQAELFDVFGIQIVWNAPNRQATFHATITDTTVQTVTALLARASDTHTGSTAHNAATSTDTSRPPVEGSRAHPYNAESAPHNGEHGQAGGGRQLGGLRPLDRGRKRACNEAPVIVEGQP